MLSQWAALPTEACFDTAGKLLQLVTRLKFVIFVYRGFFCLLAPYSHMCLFAAHVGMTICMCVQVDCRYARKSMDLLSPAGMWRAPL